MKLFKQYAGLQREVYVICICNVIDKLGALIGPMLTLLLSLKLGFSAGEIARWSLVYSFIALPAGLLGGRLADKVNKKLLINICDISSSIIFITCGLFELSKITVVCYLVGSVLQTVESPAYSVFVADITKSKDRERANSLIYLAGNFGLILAPILGGLLLDRYASLIFICSGVSEFASIIVFDLCIKETKLTADRDNVYETVTEKAGFFTVMKQNVPVFWFSMIVAVTFLAYNQFSYILPLDYAAQFGDRGSVIYGTVTAVNCITVLAATSLVTALIAKMRTLDKMILGELFELGGYVLFVFFLQFLPMGYVASFVFTIGEIIETITTAPYILNRIPANFRGRITAVLDVFPTVVVSLGNLGIGAAYDAWGSKIAWAVVAGLFVLVVVGFRILTFADKKRYPELYEKQTPPPAE